ncbi:MULTISPECIES: SDR family NAD(P)-dependent oxidoreductase [unclassified Acinetobacter]|uniref:SDR family NAD(P)-dependent oxidoreductase n=1 Tax=unclassified Acinetobacter TaxID=196816 RepID=UPI002934608E|nr:MULTISPECIES: SDR family NAD(P)-dependent oxidoreductase [unclassified Acinetobacter]WOE31305.1 SDR family NAD(P)-dependent oxidoreductase [Acinetobacter sp. SAAs470]WOE39501.1 SDR family NAD(P)-dependent oxidoreductase [Acinetobacter sp. SAAs474]
MSKKQRILIIGATSTIAEHCARQWLAKDVTEIILVARNLEKLHRMAQDLKVRYPHVEIQLQQVDFLSVASVQVCIEQIYVQAAIDIALIAQGTLPDQQACENNLELLKQAIDINALSPVLFSEMILSKMIALNFGRLAVIGSVAGDRGRKSNYIYGASKALIEKYVQGVQHRLALIGSDVSITLIKPGPTATAMTENMATTKSLASPEQVAKAILQAVEQRKHVLYTPAKWAVIMLIIKNLPFFLFKKMDI